MDIRTILPIVLLSLSCASANVMANGTRVSEAKYDPLAEESHMITNLQKHISMKGRFHGKMPP